MRTCRGERTDAGWEVKVDGEPLPVRSDLSGDATTPYDWGYVGAGQLSPALLSNLTDDDRQSQAVAAAFERAVVAHLSHHARTLTEAEMYAALVPLAAEAAVAEEATAGTTRCAPPRPGVTCRASALRVA